MFTNKEIRTEQWKPIPGFPGYSASTLGRIRREPMVRIVPMIGGSYYKTHGQKVLSPFANGTSKKPAVHLARDGAKFKRYVIHLVARTWLDVHEDDLRYNRVDISFKDGNEYNYRLDNLEVR